MEMVQETRFASRTSQESESAHRKRLDQNHNDQLPSASPPLPIGPAKRRVQLTFTNHDTQRELTQSSSSSSLDSCQGQTAAAARRPIQSASLTNRQGWRSWAVANLRHGSSSAECEYESPGGRKLRYLAASQSQRFNGPRLSLLGKPICLSTHKSHYRDTNSMRWKKRLRNFLEQPQGLWPWLYHSFL